MNIFEKIRAKKNTSRLLNICSCLIDKYEKENKKVVPSCKKDLITLLKKRFDKAQEEIADWKDYDTDYIIIAHSMLAHATFDLLTSGSYHIYAGTLNPMSCAPNLMTVYSCTMEHAVKTGEITEDVRQDQFEHLRNCITEVG